MEPQVEKNEEGEKPLAKRRSSILKLPKPRNPFEEIEATATFTDINFSKAARRVSFASSNFVKPFVADPEKNTIWDTTYEEDVNHTNSTQSSQEQNALSTKFGSTFFDSTAAKSLASVVNATTMSQHDMEITKAFTIDKENIPLICPPSEKFSLIDYAKKLSTNEVVPVFDLPGKRSGVFDYIQGGNATKNMEFTCADVDLEQNVGDVTTMDFSCQDLKASQDESMEFTCHVPGGNVTKLGNDMEFTCQVPQSVNNEIEFSCHIKQTHTDMTFTCQISEENSKKLNVLEVSKSHKNVTGVELSNSKVIDQSLRRNLKDESDMEVDATLSKSNIVASSGYSFQEKIIEGADVEEKCQIPTTELTLVDPKRDMKVDPTLSKSNIVTSKGYSFQKKVIEGADVEEKCQIPTTELTSVDLQRDMEVDPTLSKSNIVASSGYSFQKKIIEGADVEAKCQIPTTELTSVALERDMELGPTLSKSNNVASSGHSFQKKIIEGADVEAKCQIPTTELTSVDLERGMEVDPTLSKSNIVTSGGYSFQKKIIESADVEAKCQIPTTELTSVDLERDMEVATLSKSNILASRGYSFQKKIMKGGDVEAKNQIPTTEPTSVDLERDMEVDPTLSKSNIVASRGYSFQKKIIEGADVEAKCQIPSTEPTSVDLERDMEVYPTLSKSNIVTSRGYSFQKKIIEGADVEAKCQIPTTEPTSIDLERDMEVDATLSKSNINVTSSGYSFQRKIIKGADVEAKCQIPTTEPTSVDLEKNMEVDPTLSKSNIVTSSGYSFQKKIIEGSDVGLKCQISTTEPTSVDKNEPLSKNNTNVTCDSPKKLNERRLDCETSKINLTNTHLQSDKKSNESTLISSVKLVKNEINDTKTNEKENTPKKLTKFEEKENTPLPIRTRVSQPINDYDCPLNMKEPQSKPPELPLHTPTHHETSKICSFISSDKWRTPTPQKTTPTTLSSRRKQMKTMFQMKDEASLQKTLNISKLKHDLSALRTPDATLPLKSESFHINLTNLSSGIDDTEQLLQCTYSKAAPPYSFLLSRLEKSDTHVINLEDTGHVSRPNLTDLSDLEEILPDITVDNIQRNKLSNINDTYVLRNRKNHCKLDVEETDDASDDDVSLGILPDEDMQVEQVEAFSCNLKRSPKKIERKEYHYEIRRVSEISDLLKNIQTQKNHIVSYLENFKFRKMRVPKEFTVLDNSSHGSTESFEESVTTTTIEENVRKHQKSCQNCWKLEKVDDDVFYFSTLFGTLIFEVSLTLDTGIVMDIETQSKLSDKSQPLARYILKFFKDKLDDHHVSSAIGHQYDVLSLLDYVQMTMLRLHSLQKEFITCDNMTMEKDFVVRYKIMSVPLVLSCDIFVDVRNIESLNCDEAIKIVTHIGTVNENDVKNLAKNCPKGLDFFKHFGEAIEEYLRIKEKRKHFSKGH